MIALVGLIIGLVAATYFAVIQPFGGIFWGNG
jgi:hypothetical protein